MTTWPRRAFIYFSFPPRGWRECHQKCISWYVPYFPSANGTSDALVRARTLGPRDIETLLLIQVVTCVLIFAGLNLIAPAFAGWFRDPRLEILLWIRGK